MTLYRWLFALSGVVLVGAFVWWSLEPSRTPGMDPVATDRGAILISGLVLSLLMAIIGVVFRTVDRNG